MNNNFDFEAISKSFKNLQISEEDALEVVEILATSSGTENKIRLLSQLNIEKVDLIVLSLTVLMIHDTTQQHYMSILENKKEDVVNLYKLSSKEVVAHITKLALIFQGQALIRSKSECLELFLLLLPLLFSTGLVSLSLATEILYNVVQANNLSVSDIIRWSDVVAKSNKDTPLEMPQRHLH